MWEFNLYSLGLFFCSSGRHPCDSSSHAVFGFRVEVAEGKIMRLYLPQKIVKDFVFWDPCRNPRNQKPRDRKAKVSPRSSRLELEGGSFQGPQV